MATTYTSEKIYTTNGDARYMQVTCKQTKGTSSENKSTISWTITTAGSEGTSYSTGPTTLKIGGTQRYYKGRVEWGSMTFPATAGSTSGSFTVSHKSDGTIDPIKVELTTAIYTGSSNASTVSGTWTLDPISRYFSGAPTLTSTAKEETKISMSWATTETCSKVIVYYKTSSATSYTSKTIYENTTGAKSGTFSLTGLAANTTYNIYIKATRKDSGLASDSTKGSYTTYQYPYISAISKADLVIGQAQTVTIHNPLGRSVTVYMSNTDKSTTSGTFIYSGTTTAKTLTFTPTAATMYAKIPSASSATTYYYCYYGTTYVSSKSGKYKIKGDEKPTFATGSITFKDTNTTVTGITGQTANGGWLVQKLSTLTATLATVATAKNSATISSYSATIAGQKKTLGKTAGSTVSWSNLNVSGTQKLIVTATDSRGLQGTFETTVTFKPYTAPSIAIKGGRENNYGTTVNLTATYACSSVEGKNGIKVSWSGASKSGYFKNSSGTALGSSTTYATATSGTGTGSATGVNNSSAYTFTATIIDKFGKSATAKLPVPMGLPIMFIDDTQVGVGVNCFPEGQGLYVKDNVKINGKRLLQKFDIKLSGLSSENFYPVVFNTTIDRIDCEIISPSSGGSAAWNQNAISFSIKHTGWADTPKSLNIYHYGVYSEEEITIGCIAGGQRTGHVCVWLRGGLNYNFYANIPATLHTSDFTAGDEVYSVGTGYSGGTNSYLTVLFTPLTTIKAGMYVDKSIRVAGNLKAGTINSEGAITATGDLSAANTKASQSVYANNGYLYSVCSGKTTKIGAGSVDHTHYVTDANKSHWFNKTVQVCGQLFKGGAGNQNVPAVFVQTSQPTATQTGDIWVA